MAKEITINPEGIASVVAAEATPSEAFADLVKQAAHFGVTEKEFNDLAGAYFSARADNPIEKKDAYVSAFHAAMTQWIVLLVRFGGYDKEELPDIYHEFMSSLKRKAGVATIPDIRDTAMNSMESLYFAFRVRGIDDDAILEAAKKAFAKPLEELGEPTTAGMDGVSAIGGLDAIATHLAGLYNKGLTQDDVAELARTFWGKVHADDIDEKYIWKKAFFGVCTQWCYRLSLEGGMTGQSGQLVQTIGDFAKLINEGSKDLTKEELVNEALESTNAYLIVCGLTQDEVIQEAKKAFDFE